MITYVGRTEYAEKRADTEYKGKDALFESDSYSYYVLSEEPSYYKELTVGEDGSFTFSAIKGQSAAPETKQVQAEFKTKSNYGWLPAEVW
mgnify:CR=1 FL=1